VTASGVLHPCLGQANAVDLKRVLRGDGGDAAVMQAINSIVTGPYLQGLKQYGYTGPVNVRQPIVNTGNPNIVVAAAAELPRLSLADALLVVLVFARARAPQTEAAAVRWAARYVAEVRPAPEAREAHLDLSAACALAGAFPAAGRDALHALATRRRLNDLCRALDEWEPPEL